MALHSGSWESGRHKLGGAVLTFCTPLKDGTHQMWQVSTRSINTEFPFSSATACVVIFLLKSLKGTALALQEYAVRLAIIHHSIKLPRACN